MEGFSIEQIVVLLIFLGIPILRAIGQAVRRGTQQPQSPVSSDFDTALREDDDHAGDDFDVEPRPVLSPVKAALIADPIPPRPARASRSARAAKPPASPISSPRRKTRARIDRRGLRRAVVLMTILGPPRALEEPDSKQV